MRLCVTILIFIFPTKLDSTTPMFTPSSYSKSEYHVSDDGAKMCMSVTYVKTGGSNHSPNIRAVAKYLGYVGI